MDDADCASALPGAAFNWRAASVLGRKRTLVPGYDLGMIRLSGRPPRRSITIAAEGMPVMVTANAVERVRLSGTERNRSVASAVGTRPQ
jgi:hypothetical protein